MTTKRALVAAQKLAVRSFVEGLNPLTDAIRQGGERSLDERLSQAVSDHLAEVSNWSAQVQFLRMPSARDVDTETIDLKFNSAPRKFRSAAGGGSLLSETELLQSARHILVLGGPGAGKTTTLKRLCRILMSTAGADAGAERRMPILVRLRTLAADVDRQFPLLTSLANALGLNVRVPEARTLTQNKLEDGTTQVVEVVKRGKPLCEEQPIDVFVPRVLNHLGAIVMLDGLDETPSTLRADTESDIELLVSRGESYKVFLTCRSGEYDCPLGYMTAVEVCELKQTDIRTLSARWLGARSADFLAKLGKPSLSELASRPLFLTHMLTIYDLDGSLPQQPFEVYELVVMLMIREWDRERRMFRLSRYADFGPEKKLRFLAAIAYHLTYKACIKVFSRSDLLAIYARICHSFDLPEKDGEQVVAELESHTGIVVESGIHSYEFSHLTIQEYLCAAHLVRSPFPHMSIAKLLAQYPAPLAVAAALSADPAAWVAGILLSEGIFQDASPAGDIDIKVDLFLERLVAENPIFVHSGAIGCCILALAMRLSAVNRSTKIQKHLDLLVSRPIARESFVDIVTTAYRLTMDLGTGEFYVALRNQRMRTLAMSPAELPYGIDMPDEGRIPRVWLEDAFAKELRFDGPFVARR